jgi:hypothetical protein
MLILAATKLVDLNGACDRAGVPRARIHALRHTFGLRETHQIPPNDIAEEERQKKGSRKEPDFL